LNWQRTPFSLLVRVIDIALILGNEGGHDAIVGLTKGGFDVLGTLPNRIDGLMDG
jgi:hypothetical protein